MVSFACTLCGRGFAEKRYLAEHTRRVHSQNKPFACARCDRSYARKYDLQRHVESHVGVRRFACAVCGKDFVLAKHRDAHQRAVHTTRYARTFFCGVCGRRFEFRSYWLKHQRRHADLDEFLAGLTD